MKNTGRDEKGAAYYDEVFRTGKHYLTEDFRKFKGYEWWHRFAHKFEGVERVLDLGCGPGHFARFCHSIGIPYYFGVDFSEVAIERAQAWAWDNDLDPKYVFFKGDLYEAIEDDRPPPDLAASGVVVTALAVLEHLERDVELLAALPPGMRFIGLVPSIDSVSHVRYFEHPSDVRSRYGHLFDPLQIITYRAGSRRVYVFEGIIKEPAEGEPYDPFMHGFR